MSVTTWIALGAGVVIAARVATRGSNPTRPPASWDVPHEQQAQIDRLNQAAGFYASGRPQDARAILTDRYTDWNLIREAAQHSLDAHARRIGAVLADRGRSAFINELHRQTATSRAAALDAIISALNDYTDRADSRGTAS